MPFIRCRNLTKTYRKGDASITPLSGLDLDIERGEFLALMGPSGSGETTLLNLVAGIDRPTSGHLHVDDVDLAGLSPGRLADWRSASVGYVFQLYNLVPVLTAYENVELPLLLHRLGRRERHRRVAAFTMMRPDLTLVDEEAARTCCPPSPTEAQSNAPCPAPPERRATISVLDGQGRPLAVDLRGRHGLTPGAEVFVVGAVATPAAPGGLAVTADAIHVPEASLPVGTFLPAEPAGALDVAEVRKRAGKGETVVLVGRVGGSVRPFVPGRAIFTLVGRGLKACSDIPGDECTKPWDYCCETKEAILANSATIQFVAPGGGKAGPLRTEIKGRTGPGGGRSIRELSELVVVGTVSVAEKGALVVNATQVFVR